MLWFYATVMTVDALGSEFQSSRKPVYKKTEDSERMETAVVMRGLVLPWPQLGGI
jgi:hypothetical protein